MRTTIQKRVLGNGLKVLVRRDASAPVVAIVTHVNAGYFDETDDVADEATHEIDIPAAEVGKGG